MMAYLMLSRRGESAGNPRGVPVRPKGFPLLPPRDPGDDKQWRVTDWFASSFLVCRIPAFSHPRSECGIEGEEDQEQHAKVKEVR
jgi:hypothetical protein